jgi:hypothetical protein
MLLNTGKKVCGNLLISIFAIFVLNKLFSKILNLNSNFNVCLTSVATLIFYLFIIFVQNILDVLSEIELVLEIFNLIFIRFQDVKRIKCF